jgi:probable F420-dependent oxidoreductase
VPDHFDEGYGPITAMATAAAATEELHVSAAVMCVDFRHPAVLARELAAIDRLSDGRLEVGLGAGYQVLDYEASGIRMDRAGVRVDRLIEYVTVLRGLFSPGPFDFDGDHYQVKALTGTPAPARPGGPPIVVAGGGKRLLRFAAEHADVIGVNPSLPDSRKREKYVSDGFADRIDEKFELIRAAAGPRFDSITFHAWVKKARLTEDARPILETTSRSLGISVEDVSSMPFYLIGSVDEVVERLHERRERWGYSYYTVLQEVAHEFAPVLARLAEEAPSS